MKKGLAIIAVIILLSYFLTCGSKEVKKVKPENTNIILDVDTYINKDSIRHKISKAGSLIVLEIKTTIPCKLKICETITGNYPKWLKLYPPNQSMEGTRFKMNGTAQKGKYSLLIIATQLDDPIKKVSKKITFDIR